MRLTLSEYYSSETSHKAIDQSYNNFNQTQFSLGFYATWFYYQLEDHESETTPEIPIFSYILNNSLIVQNKYEAF